MPWGDAGRGITDLSDYLMQIALQRAEERRYQQQREDRRQEQLADLRLRGFVPGDLAYEEEEIVRPEMRTELPARHHFSPTGEEVPEGGGAPLGRGIALGLPQAQELRNIRIGPIDPETGLGEREPETDVRRALREGVRPVGEIYGEQLYHDPQADPQFVIQQALRAADRDHQREMTHLQHQLSREASLEDFERRAAREDVVTERTNRAIFEQMKAAGMLSDDHEFDPHFDYASHFETATGIAEMRHNEAMRRLQLMQAEQAMVPDRLTLRDWVPGRVEHYMDMTDSAMDEPIVSPELAGFFANREYLTLPASVTPEADRAQAYENLIDFIRRHQVVPRPDDRQSFLKYTPRAEVLTREEAEMEWARIQNLPLGEGDTERHPGAGVPHEQPRRNFREWWGDMTGEAPAAVPEASPGGVPLSPTAGMATRGSDLVHRVLGLGGERVPEAPAEPELPYPPADVVHGIVDEMREDFPDLRSWAARQELERRLRERGFRMIDER